MIVEATPSPGLITVTEKPGEVGLDVYNSRTGHHVPVEMTVAEAEELIRALKMAVFRAQFDQGEGALVPV